VDASALKDRFSPLVHSVCEAIETPLRAERRRLGKSAIR